MAARAAFSSTVPAAVLLLLLLAAADVRLAGATEYTVGDSEGWTIGPSYLAWSQKYNLTSGDTLARRVPGDAGRVPDVRAANQTMGRWASGHDVVELTAPGDYYFICNVSGHCLGGMKFSVAVGEPLPPPSSPPPPVGSGAAASTRRSRRDEAGSRGRTW
ncbi:hypothetical protein ABZP36_034599 [Zizania latifolia]